MRRLSPPARTRRRPPPAAWKRGSTDGPEPGGTAVTPKRLTHAVTAEGLRAHLEALQRIADEHDGNRSSGTPATTRRSSTSSRRSRKRATNRACNPSATSTRGRSLPPSSPRSRRTLRPMRKARSSSRFAIRGAARPTRSSNPSIPTPRRAAATRPISPRFEPGSIALVRRGGCFFAAQGRECAFLGRSDGHPRLQRRLPGTRTRSKRRSSVPQSYPRSPSQTTSASSWRIPERSLRCT